MLFPTIFALSFISGFFLPWWFAAVICFAAGFFIKTSGSAFWAGFPGVGLTWMAFALLKTLPNDNVLASKMAVLFHLPGWIFVLIITVLIGGLVGGLSCLSGALLKKICISQPNKKTIIS